MTETCSSGYLSIYEQVQLVTNKLTYGTQLLSVDYTRIMV